MKNNIIHIILFLFLSCGMAQAQSPIQGQVDTLDNTISTFTDEDPYFTEGNFASYLTSHFKSTKEMDKNWKYGTITLGFVVEKDGSVSKVFVVKGKGLSPLQDAEAIRVVQSSSGKWIPGKINGEPVRCYFKQQLIFQ